MKLAVLLASVLLFSCALAGCGSGPSEMDEPPLVAFTDLRYWFEGDLLVLNFTLVNQGNWTPGPPLTHTPWLHFVLTARSVKETPGNGNGDDLDSGDNFRSGTLHLSSTEAPHWEKRWYEGESAKLVGANYTDPFPSPVRLNPGEPLNLEYAILPTEHFDGGEGYYDWYIVFVIGNTHDLIGSDTRFRSGCFNHDVDEFYGVSSTGPDCHRYDGEGRDTRSGMALFEGEFLGRPQMRRDPPAGVEGAH